MENSIDERELRENLQCPVCLQVPHKTKILACSVGHQICKLCYRKLPSSPKTCPLARCRYNSPPTRLRMLETMISQANIKLNCTNSGRGCQVELKSQDLTEHELECQFRLVPCPVAACQEQVVLSQLNAHNQEKNDHDIELPLPDGELIYLKRTHTAHDRGLNMMTSFWVQDGFRF